MSSPRIQLRASSDRASRRRALIVLLAFVVALAGCAAIPTSGPVRSQPLPDTDPGTIFVEAERPIPGANPVEITQGFIRAQAAGVYDDFRVAREFLTSARAATWDPRAGTTVYLGEPTLTATGPGGAIDLTDDVLNNREYVDVGGPVSLAAQVDSTGVFIEATVGAEQPVSFRLSRENDQWRIAEVQDGTLVSLPNFTATYRRIALQFLSPDERYLVPDVRWYPVRNLAGYATEGLLAGPSAWLRDSVRSAVPGRTTLNVAGAVQVTPDGVVEIELSNQVIATNAEQRSVLMAQFNATLLQVPQVRSVTLRAGSVDITTSQAQLTRDPTTGAALTVVRDGQIGNMIDGEFVPNLAFERYPEDAISAIAVEPADGVHGGRLVVTRQGSSLFPAALAGTDLSESAPYVRGRTVSKPSVDRHGWIWSAVNGRILVMNGGGIEVPNVPWLVSRDVTSVRVSRDGARVAIASTPNPESSDQSVIEIAGIVRDDRGAPTSLVQGVAIGGALTAATDITWIGESSVAVLGTGSTSVDQSVYSVPIGDLSQIQPTIDTAAEIAGDWDARSIHVRQADGDLQARSSTGASWSDLLVDVTAIAYPG